MLVKHETWKVVISKKEFELNEIEVAAILANEQSINARFIKMKGLIINPAFIETMTLLRSWEDHELLDEPEEHELSDEQRQKNLDRMAKIREQLRLRRHDHNVVLTEGGDKIMDEDQTTVSEPVEETDAAVEEGAQVPADTTEEAAAE